MPAITKLLFLFLIFPFMCRKIDSIISPKIHSNKEIRQKKIIAKTSPVVHLRFGFKVDSAMGMDMKNRKNRIITLISTCTKMLSPLFAIVRNYKK